jgi:putative flippase GtrA
VIEKVRDNLNSTFRVIDQRESGRRLRNETGAWRPIAMRWLKFNAVGALGIAVQLAVLLGLRTGLHLSYLLATALAVEAAVVHNFLWHERYTWADRVKPSWRKSLPRLLRFNLTTGGVSIAGNLALMKAIVGWGHLNYLVANGIAIALCSLVNFLVSEGWVFEKARKDRAKKCRVRLAVRRE